MRLIDADALFNWGKHKLSDAVKYGNKDEEHQDFSYIADEVDEAPTIDAVPVVRGEWVKSDDYKGWLVCSACHDCYVDNEWVNGKKWRYCPNCGALMEDKPCKDRT